MTGTARSLSALLPPRPRRLWGWAEPQSTGLLPFAPYFPGSSQLSNLTLYLHFQCPGSADQWRQPSSYLHLPVDEWFVEESYPLVDVGCLYINKFSPGGSWKLLVSCLRHQVISFSHWLHSTPHFPSALLSPHMPPYPTPYTNKPYECWSE